VSELQRFLSIASTDDAAFATQHEMMNTALV